MSQIYGLIMNNKKIELNLLIYKVEKNTYLYEVY
jgi:hypothetical protein